MTDKRDRKTRVSSGVRKNRTNASGRKSPVVSDFLGLLFIRHQAENRWPDPKTEDKYAELNRAKRPRRKPGKIKPAGGGFTLLDMAIDKGRALDTLLTAASLKLKKVRRYPGYVLIHTYNLKNRPIDII
jgi:hypothetical protein